jgi:hypothetical protein
MFCQTELSLNFNFLEKKNTQAAIIVPSDFADLGTSAHLIIYKVDSEMSAIGPSSWSGLFQVLSNLLKAFHDKNRVWVLGALFFIFCQ